MPRPPRASKTKAIQRIKKMFKRRPRRNTVLVNTALKPFAQRYITKMKFSQALVLSGTGPLSKRYRLNSVFDPDETGTGHQPYGHDTLAQIYNRYRVISCSYVISAVDGGYIQCSALPANDNVSPGSLTVSEIRENPRAKYIVQAPNASLKMLTGKVYLPSLVGRNKAQYMADDRYQAQVGSNPAEASILNIFVQNMADSTTIGINANLNVTLEYTVEWFDVKNFGQS